jgi:2-dehydro-3-deoxy-D-arabinonate dehydratase
VKGEWVPLCYYRVADADQPKLGFLSDDHIVDLEAAGGPAALSAALQLPAGELLSLLAGSSNVDSSIISVADVTFAAPLDEQEVWAAGVTYLRSRDARMEESTQRDIYDRVYDADRPELFLKATPHRVAGPGAPVAIRGDSGWDVPEPELAVLMNARGERVGYTIGNDVSSRSIEGENPLYLPQAKVYSGCAALGPVIVMADELPDVSNLDIQLTIRRDGAVLFQDGTSTSRLHRSLDELSEYLWRANDFPAGVYLMTGTGIVPPSEFTLRDGDEVTISVAGIGSLTNPVVRLDS